MANNPNEKSIRMLRAYRQMADIDKNMFMTSFFKTSPEDITNAEFISIDVEREDEEMAPVLTDISTGAHVVSEDIYTNKTIKPPAMALKMPFNVWDLTNRMPGQTEYDAANVSAQAAIRVRVLKSWRKMQNMIKRTIESQAAQLLQTGKMTLYDKDGNARYVLDYKPKSTHFANAGVKWATTASADPLADIEAMADVIRDDGLVNVENVVIGSTAFKNFLKNSTVEKYFAKDGFFLGSLDPVLQNSGAKVQGTISIGAYNFVIWTYNGRYIDLSDTTKKPYLAVDKVVMLPNQADLDFRKAFGAIPVVIDSDERLRDILPSRVSVPGAFDFKPRIFTDENAETMYSEIKSRPLLVPVSIDRYGCIDTDF